MPATFRKPKAMVTPDMVIALVIFLSMVSVAFYYMNYLSKTKQPFDATLQTQGYEIAKSISENISWTIYKSRIIITSDNSSYSSFEQYFRPPSETDLNSIDLLDANSKEIPSGFFGNTLIWTTNISKGKNTFFIVYSKNTSLSANTYQTGINASGLWLNNSKINVSFSSSGISNIIFGGSDILGNGIDFGTSSAPQNNVLATRAKINYTEGVSAAIYSNISKIIVRSNASFSPIIYLSPGFTNYYNGTENAFSSGGQQFNSILNFTDIYSASRGIAFIGNGLNISVSNTTYKEVHLYNTTEFEIYMHQGDYTNALVERDIYLDAPKTIISIPFEITGISISKLDALKALPYSGLRNSFGKSSRFNLTIEDAAASIGEKIPSDRNVFVISYPISVLGRLGNVTGTTFNVAVWLGSDY